MSIRTEHASRIYSGDKLFEFRRRRPRFKLGLKVFIYEPAPVRAVTGYFSVGSMLDVEGNLNILESNQIAQAHAESYLLGARRPTAIKISAPTRFAESLPLGVFGMNASPQSYVFVDCQ